MNSVNLIGRIGNEPELKKLEDGRVCTSISLGVDKRTKESRITDWVGCSAWGKTAETIVQYAHKGDRLAVSGSITTRTYEKEDGSKVKLYDVLISGFDFLSDRRAESGEPATAPVEPGTDTPPLPFEI